MSGLDASFLYLETPSLHMHVSMAAVFDPATVPGGYSFEKVRDVVAARLLLAPQFRRRLVEVQLRLGHPSWVDDLDFDVEFHVHRGALPAPGGTEELATYVGNVSSRQLDRSRPLWELHVVEGLRHGRIAVVAKVHHCAVDGVTGAQLLARLFDLEPDPPVLLHPEDLPPRRDEADERVPSDVELMARAVVGRITSPVAMSRLALRTAKALFDVRRVRGRVSQRARAALPLTAPRTSLNAAITAHRSVAFAAASLDDVKRVKNALGCTVNDVVLAVCTGALRSYLAERGELPAGPLVATVPVSVAEKLTTAGRGQRPGANQLSVMFVSLPCAEGDPLVRLEAIRESTRGAKEEHDALGADILMNWSEHASPNLFAGAARAYSALKLAEHHRPIHNLVISNIPGPDFPLYLAGAELVATFPLGPVVDGAGLNITVMSYRGIVNWGFIACTESVPGLKGLAAAVPRALEELLAAAGLSGAGPLPAAVSVTDTPGAACRAPSASARAVAERVAGTTSAPDRPEAATAEAPPVPRPDDVATRRREPGAAPPRRTNSTAASSRKTTASARRGSNGARAGRSSAPPSKRPSERPSEQNGVGASS